MPDSTTNESPGTSVTGFTHLGQSAYCEQWWRQSQFVTCPSPQESHSLWSSRSMASPVQITGPRFHHYTVLIAGTNVGLDNRSADSLQTKPQYQSIYIYICLLAVPRYNLECYGAGHSPSISGQAGFPGCGSRINSSSPGKNVAY